MRALLGRWQDVLPTLADASLDAIYFDTYGEYDADMATLHAELPRLLVWFAGEDPFLLCERIVRALAAREAARLQLRLQLCVESMPPPEEGDEVLSPTDLAAGASDDELRERGGRRPPCRHRCALAPPSSSRDEPRAPRKDPLRLPTGHHPPRAVRTA